MTLVRMADGLKAGEKITLGKIWCLCGKQLPEPLQELPEHYAEIPASESELARRSDLSPVIEAISRRTREAINNNFSYKGHSMDLSIENQINYREALDFAKNCGGKNLPLIFKAKFRGRATYIPFTSVEALEELCSGMRQHISACLNRGWELKRKVASLRWDGLPTWLTEQFPFLLTPDE